MAVTKKEVKEQLKYMLDNKKAYLKNISKEEYNRRLKKLRIMRDNPKHKWASLGI